MIIDAYMGSGFDDYGTYVSFEHDDVGLIEIASATVVENAISLVKSSEAYKQVCL